MRPIWTFAAATLAAAMMQTAQAADATPPTKRPSLYERIEEEMAARPDLAKQAGRPAKEMAQVAWLVGEWDVTANVFATRKSPAQTSKGRSRIANALVPHSHGFARMRSSGTRSLSVVRCCPGDISSFRLAP